MSSNDGEYGQGGSVRSCTNGHRVAEHDVFCPVCLELVSRPSAVYWTVNDGRDLHPSSAHADALDEMQLNRHLGGYCHRKGQ